MAIHHLQFSLALQNSGAAGTPTRAREDPAGAGFASVSVNASSFGAGGSLVEGHHLGSNTSTLAACTTICAGTENLSPINYGGTVSVGWTDASNPIDALRGTSQSFELGLGPIGGSYSTTAVPRIQVPSPVIDATCNTGSLSGNIPFTNNNLSTSNPFSEYMSNQPPLLFGSTNFNSQSLNSVLENIDQFRPLQGPATTTIETNIGPPSGLLTHFVPNIGVYPGVPNPYTPYKPPQLTLGLPFQANSCHVRCDAISPEYPTGDSYTGAILDDLKLQEVIDYYNEKN